MMRRLGIWLIIGLTAVISTAAVWMAAGTDKIYRNFDGPLYITVAKSWYAKGIIAQRFSFPLPLEYYPAHFPLYPYLINVISLSGINRLQAMLLINLTFAIAGAITVYEIANRRQWGGPLVLALAWLFVWPRMWAVRSIGSPETLFITLLMLSLYTFSVKKYLLVGIFGALAVWTKSPGILLIPTFLIINFHKNYKDYKSYIPVGIMLAAVLGLFGFFKIQTGDFWAYFHTGDNIHLQTLPFRVFDSDQPWVGSWWLEDVLWIYAIAGIGVWRAFKKDPVWGWWGAIFLTVILFVSHRDIARYSLPLVPSVLLGFGEIFAKKEVKIILVLMIVPMFFYTLNFVTHNVMPIGNWGPFL
jgi:hypothetical protein